MGKKKEVVIEELESEEEFDGGFSQDDSEDAPVQVKDTRKRTEKLAKPIKKAPRIRGADIFAQELPASAVEDLKHKQA